MHDPEHVLEALTALRAHLLQERPTFKAFIDRHGERTIFDCAAHLLTTASSHTPRLTQRRRTAIRVLEGEVAHRLGEDAARHVALHLLATPTLNTTDHHALLDHPFWVNTNLITSLPMPRYLVVLAFASVSQNTAAGYPRGILFHGGDYGEGNLIRLPFLADRTKMAATYGTPPYNRTDVDRARALLRAKAQAGFCTSQRRQRVEELLTFLLADSRTLDAPDFVTQISRINHLLWPVLFPTGAHLPELIYLDIESIVRELFIQDVLIDPASLPYRMLFDPPTRALFADEVYCSGDASALPQLAANGKARRPTFAFWGRTTKGYRVPLRLGREELTSMDPTAELTITLTPDGIREALAGRSLFPSTLTDYMLLAFYYGFTCLGGFQQMNDLTRLRTSYLHALSRLGEGAEISEVSSIPTDAFSGCGIILTYHLDSSDALRQSTGIDIALNPRRSSHPQFVALARAVTLNEALPPLMVDMCSMFGRHTTIRDPGDAYGRLTHDAALTATQVKQKLLMLYRTLGMETTLG